MRHYPEDPGRQTAGRGTQGFSPCDIRPHLEMAGSAQERTEAREVLPVRVRLEVRFRMRESVSLRASGVARHRCVLLQYAHCRYYNLFLFHVLLVFVYLSCMHILLFTCIRSLLFVFFLLLYVTREVFSKNNFLYIKCLLFPNYRGGCNWDPT